MKNNFCVAAAFLAVFALIFTACPGDDGNNGGNNGGQTGGGGEPAGLIHQWLLDGDGNDSVGTATLTMNGLGMKANNSNKVPGDVATYPWLSFFGGAKGDGVDDLVIDITKMNPEKMEEAAFAWGGRTLLVSGGTHGANWGWDGCYVKDIDTSGIRNELSTTLWMWMGEVGGLRNVVILEKPTSINGGQHILTTSSGYLYLGYSLDVESCIDLDTPVGSYCEEWVHLALIYKGDSVTLYINGEKAGELIGEILLHSWWKEDGSNIDTLNPTEMYEPVRVPTLDVFKIGGQQPTQHFVGLLTDVRLYNRALTPADLKYLIDQAPQAVRDLGTFE
jgi:hypothetical protein